MCTLAVWERGISVDGLQSDSLKEGVEAKRPGFVARWHGWGYGGDCVHDTGIDL